MTMLAGPRLVVGKEKDRVLNALNAALNRDVSLAWLLGDLNKAVVSVLDAGSDKIYLIEGEKANALFRVVGNNAVILASKLREAGK